MSRIWLIAAGMLAIAAVAPGCGTERSAEAYCRAFYAKAAPIREGYVEAAENADRDPLGGLATALSASGDLESIFDGMVDHAPDEIKSDTVVVRDSLKRLQDNMGDAASNPLGSLAGNLVAGLTSAGAWQRVDRYLTEHCPTNSSLAREYIDE